MVLDRIAPVLARFIKSAVLYTNVLSLSIIINIPLYIYIFFHFKAAFDSIDRQFVWRSMLMQHYGLPDKYIRIMNS